MTKHPAAGEPTDYPELYADLREQAYARLGTRSPTCSWPGCPETDPLATVGTAPNMLCYEHDRIARDLPWVENQHSSGRGNDPATVPIPANDHRVIDAAKTVWDRETLDGKHGPLRQAAAAIRGWLDTLYTMLTRSVGWVPDLLEYIDALLVANLGVGWWHSLGLGAP